MTVGTWIQNPARTKLKIATTPGSYFEQTAEIVKQLGYKLQVVNTIDDLDYIIPDRIFLLGGRDINPVYYGEKNYYADKPNKDRDRLEWAMIRRGLSQGIPIFGICRGMQWINVAMGGSLHQDMRNAGIKTHPQNHKIFTSGSFLNNRLPAIRVNSKHHQCIKTLAPGLSAVAKSPDGVIEAIKGPGVFGVQWHPEEMTTHNPNWIKFIGWAIADGTR